MSSQFSVEMLSVGCDKEAKKARETADIAKEAYVTALTKTHSPTELVALLKSEYEATAAAAKQAAETAHMAKRKLKASARRLPQTNPKPPKASSTTLTKRLPP